ncbi:hypothetical protein CAPTEDRAFT_199620 [Capitella teleta]|uniref:Uncharacterized protein n=1 Tax=Capitella teleta TaxID=283909 RepID=R7UFS4_CAPTE|nr:hypothetical protein CAPTEDRAFT_199620 [Capitella teleta]|eukprot:ELU02648.1 hypothetical protein CAPTEDRAFT_199620 [Capitella teleta]
MDTPFLYYINNWVTLVIHTFPVMALFSQVLKQSCEGSSMKALPRLVRAKSWVQRCLWILALLVGLTAMSYQLAGLFMGYFEFSSSVNIAEIQGTPPFPDVTLCHIDPRWTFSKLETALSGEDSYTSYVHRVKTVENEYKESSDERRVLHNLRNMQGYLQNVQSIHEEGEKLRKTFILDCVVNTEWEPSLCFQGNGKNLVNTSVFIDPMFGMCVTFKVHREGTKNLDLLIYLEDEEQTQMEDFNLLGSSTSPVRHTSNNAARLVIHPQDSFPDIWLASHTVQAGKKVSVNVQATERSVLGEPYGSCITPEDAHRARDIPGFAINRHGYECYRMCAKDYIVQDCMCLDIYYASSKEDRESLQMCGDLDVNISRTIERMLCAEEVISGMDDSESMYAKCVCPTPCDQFVYEYTTEEMQWPHHIYHLSIYEQYVHNSSFAHKFKVYEDLLRLSKTNKTHAQNKVSKLDLIEKNFAEVKILNHQRTYFHYTESPLISPEALFGNLGGILNLWAGITFITIIEIIEFIQQMFVGKKRETIENKEAKKSNLINHV